MYYYDYMITYLSKYFYVKEIQTDGEEGKITGLIGYFTNQLHTMYLPTQTITCQDAINMISAGIVLFTVDKTGQRKLLKKGEISGNYNLFLYG